MERIHRVGSGSGRRELLQAMININLFTFQKWSQAGLVPEKDLDRLVSSDDALLHSPESQ